MSIYALQLHPTYTIRLVCTTAFPREEMQDYLVLLHETCTQRERATSTLKTFLCLWRLFDFYIERETFLCFHQPYTFKLSYDIVSSNQSSIDLFMLSIKNIFTVYDTFSRNLYVSVFRVVSESDRENRCKQWNFTACLAAYSLPRAPHNYILFYVATSLEPLLWESCRLHI